MGELSGMGRGEAVRREDELGVGNEGSSSGKHNGMGKGRGE